MKQWIFFDLGSTLIDERETYHLFLEHCLEVLCEAGHTLSLEEFEAKMIAFAKENKDPVKETWTFFAPSALSRPKWDHTTDILFQDVATVLGELSKSYRLGIIANQQENLAERLERFELGSYFGVVVGSADVGFRGVYSGSCGRYWPIRQNMVVSYLLPPRCALRVLS